MYSINPTNKNMTFTLSFTVDNNIMTNHLYNQELNCGKGMEKAVPVHTYVPVLPF